MVPQSSQRLVPRDTFVQMAQNLPHSILADQAHTIMKLTKHQSRHVNYVTQESTARDMDGCGPMDFVMRDSSALVGLGLSDLVILVHPTMIMQQALQTPVTLHLNVFAQHGTRQQVNSVVAAIF